MLFAFGTLRDMTVDRWGRVWRTRRSRDFGFARQRARIDYVCMLDKSATVASFI